MSEALDVLFIYFLFGCRLLEADYVSLTNLLAQECGLTLLAVRVSMCVCVCVVNVCG